MKNADVLYIFHNTLRDIHLIGNWRMGGDTTHNFAFSSYASLLGTTNIQRLNCAESAMTNNSIHIAHFSSACCAFLVLYHRDRDVAEKATEMMEEVNVLDWGCYQLYLS